MRNTIKASIITGLLACSIVAGYSQDTAYTNAVYTHERVETVHYPAEEEKDYFFNANEFGVSLNTGYVLQPGAVFQQDYVFNLGAGVHYFPSRYFGLEANVPFYTEGVSVSEVQGGVLVRIPIGRIAPYVGGSAVYAWDAAEEWAYIGKVGVEVRVNKKVGIFAEGQYRNNEFEDFEWDNGSISLVGGLRLNF